MRWQTFVYTHLLLVTANVYLFQPWPFNILLASVPWFGYVFYPLSIAAAIVIWWFTPPDKLVDPTGKAVFITGCDSGFGQEFAKHLDARGFHVFAGCLVPDGEGANGLSKQSSSKLKIVPIDVSDDLQVTEAVEFVKDNLADNELWAVVNNAGISVFSDIEWLDIKQYMKIMDVNMFGTVRVTKGFLPLLRESEGRVINVASLAGRITTPYFGAYTMSKKACIGFSDCLRQEMRKFNISVITVEPGKYRTVGASSGAVENSCEKSWAETPSDVKNVYGEEYFQTLKRLAASSMDDARPNVQEVTDSLTHAVCAEHPNIRYVPNWRDKYSVAFVCSLPVWVSDKIMAMIFPPSEPEFKKNKAPATKNKSSND